MKNTKIIVSAKSKSYPIYFGDRIISITGKLIQKELPNVKKICIICDKNVPLALVKKLKTSLKKYDLIIYKLNVSEKLKNFKIAYKLIENLLKINFNRSDCIVSLGGGVLGDLSAFISSVTKRGVKFINIPSTLLAQVDASVGGKTAINSKRGKNLIGTFYQPDFVLADMALLDSLSIKEMICGYGEILKHSLILDKKFFLWLNKNANEIIINRNKNLLKNAIVKSCKIKSKIINKDEREKDTRMILNFGHTFAHGFEAANKYTKNLNHGEAVLLGMLSACELSYRKKFLSLNDLILIKKHYLSLGLPMNIGSYFKKNQIGKIVSFMKKDKKNLNSKINLILLKKIGQTTKPNSQFISSIELKKFLRSSYI
tara:strand:- start:5406 stop:6518 length:1113 start_codon:yes stop_codon:yes gene_type:complete